MKTLKVLRSGGLRTRPSAAADDPIELPAACPAARCSRCGYEFTPYTVSAVCPRCLEPFARDPCYGGCFSCPLLPPATDES